MSKRINGIYVDFDCLNDEEPVVGEAAEPQNQLLKN